MIVDGNSPALQTEDSLSATFRMMRALDRGIALRPRLH